MSYEVYYPTLKVTIQFDTKEEAQDKYRAAKQNRVQAVLRKSAES
jgi:hypothetical protein